MNVFTQEGSPEFNARLAATLQELAQEIQSAMPTDFLALILSGGYGRGEGACVIRDGKESLYNDLDLFLVVKSPMAIPPEVKKITHTYEQQLGIEVDIGKPLTIPDIQNFPHQLMWQDLLQSHYVILGEETILTGNAPDYLLQPLPQVEALRLLLNRGSGLLQAIIQAYELSKDPQHKLPDADFVRRNRFKCTLALGDALLISHGLYSPPLSDRLHTIQTNSKDFAIKSKNRILKLYETAALFKTNPDSAEKKQPGIKDLLEIATFWKEILLYVESRRTGANWTSILAYSQDAFIRESDQHTVKRRLRNLVKNLRLKRISMRYPRERLYRQLAELLGQSNPADEKWMQEAQEFLRVWSQYN
jgi:hypothetical protein